MSLANHSGQRSWYQPIKLWPGRFRLQVAVPRVRCTLEHIQLAQGVSTLGAWTLTPENIRQAHADWTFAEAETPQGPSDLMVFTWNPPVTTEQRATEIVATEYDSIAYPWPPILEDAAIVYDGVNQRLAVRQAYRESYQGKSTVVVRRYVSATPWTADELAKDPPQATVVNTDYFGLPVNFGECLHPLIELDSAESDSAVKVDLMPTRSGQRKVGKRRIFPSTNHVTWEDHIYDAQVQEESGLYFLTTFEVLAPELTPISYAT